MSIVTEGVGVGVSVEVGTAVPVWVAVMVDVGVDVDGVGVGGVGGVRQRDKTISNPAAISNTPTMIRRLTLLFTDLYLSVPH